MSNCQTKRIIQSSLNWSSLFSPCLVCLSDTLWRLTNTESMFRNFLFFGFMAVVAPMLQLKDPSDEGLKRVIDKLNHQSLCWGEPNLFKFIGAYNDALKQCSKKDVGNETQTSLAADIVRHLEDYSFLIPFPGFILQDPSISTNVLKRKKRSNGILNPDAKEKKEIYENWEDLWLRSRQNIENLNCWMKALGMLGDNDEINLEYFTKTVWEKIETYDSAAGERDYASEIISGLETCHSVSQALPKQSSSLYPIYHEQNLLFLKCGKRVEVKICSRYVMKQLMDMLYGSTASVELDFIPQPVNKFKAAELKLQALWESLSPEKQFVEKAIWQRSKF